MKIGAVIPTYNRKKLLEEAIDSLLIQTRQPDEIIIINNASTDGTAEMLETKYKSKVTHLRLGSNTGSSGGFYYGVKKAMELKCDWVLIIDDDSELYPDSLEKLLANEKFTETTAVLSPLKKDIDGSLLFNRHFGYYDFSIFGYNLKGLSEEDLKKPFIEIDMTSFTGMFINAKAIRQIGLPSDRLFTQREDDDYCFRLRKYGKIYLIPESIILHKEKANYLVVKRFGHEFRRSRLNVVWKEYYGFRNVLYLFKEGHFPKWRYINFMWYTVKTILAICFLDKHRLIRLKYYFWGLYDGLRGHFGKTILAADFMEKYKDKLE